MHVSNHSAHRKAVSFLLFLIMTISCFSVPSNAYATGESITTSSGAKVYNAGTGPSVIDSSLEISGSAMSANISSAKVYLSSGFDSAVDSLIYPAKIGNITGSYTSADGVLQLSGTDTLSNYQLALRSIQYQNTDATATGARSVVFSIETSSMYTLGDHYYEVIYSSSTITWKNAKAAAAERSYNGMGGYLATITSQDENDFIDQKVNADAWIGASDDYEEINAVTGTAFTAQGTAYSATSTESEGKWYWVTGPEKGTPLTKGNYPNMTTISGVYSNWAGGEPNDAGREHYAHMLSSGGQWNDYQNSLSVHYYIVEYSTTGAIVSPLIATKSLQIVQPVRASLSVSPSTIAENAGTSTITATLSTTTNQSVTVDLSFSGTATANSDYTSSGAVITIPAGNTTGSVILTGVDDPVDELNETIVVDIANVTNAVENGTQQVTVSITDDDIPGLSINDVSQSEGNSDATDCDFTVTLSPAAIQVVTVDFATNDQTATSDSDYLSTSGSLTFAAGETTKTISITINGDQSVEFDEVFSVQLSNVNNAATITRSSGAGIIINDDTIPSRSRNSDSNEVTSTVNGQTVQIGTRSTETLNGQTQTLVSVNPTTISNLINTMSQGSTLTLPTNMGTTPTSDGTKVEMTLGLVDQLFHQDITLTVDTGQVQYSLPPQSIDLTGLVSKFGADVDQSKIEFNITISDVPDKMLEVVQNTAAKDEFAIVIPPIEFNVTATYNSQTVSVNQFSQHVSREIALPAGTDPKKITTAIVVKEDGTTYHVPTDVYQKDGQWYARISSLTNSVYTLIYNEATFADTKGRWFEAPVAEAASRTILAGYADGTFRGTNPITRAEFASMIVNTLGLDRVGTSHYPDVKDANWFYGAVSRASEYKVVSGRLNGNFDPNAYITRQEAMIMMQKAGEICGLVPGEGKDANAAANAATVLSYDYADQTAISTWAKDAVEYNLKFGLMKGNNGQLKPRDNITRAEAAVTVLRLLQKSDLIDTRSAV